MVYFGARGTLIHEKNLKSKISCQTPLNVDPKTGSSLQKLCGPVAATLFVYLPTYPVCLPTYLFELDFPGYSSLYLGMWLCPYCRKIRRIA
jgi:hypothetical protein